MKLSLRSLVLFCAVCCFAIQSLAQQPPDGGGGQRDQRPNPPGDGNRGGGGGEQPRPGPGGAGPGGVGRPDGTGRPGPRGDGTARPGPNQQRPGDGNAGPDGNRPRNPNPGAGQVEAMRNYLDVFDRYTRLSRDPASAGVAAVVTAGEILRARGADSAITYFTKLLPEVKNDSVQRAIRLQLVELYKMSGQQDKALDQLQTLMTSVPAGESPMGRPAGAGTPGEGGNRPRPPQN